MFCALSDDIESTCLVLKCLKLEDYFELKLTRPVLAGVCALDDDSEPVSSLSPRDLKNIIFSCDKAILLEKYAANVDTKLISEIAQVISWSKLWDQALDKGPRCVNGLKELVRIITYPSHATRVCPKCDVNELEVSLLAHILLEHSIARFSGSDLLGALLNSDHNQVLPDSTSSEDEDHDVSSSSYNSVDNSDSDPLNYFLNMVCTLFSLFLLSCVCVLKLCLLSCSVVPTFL